MEGIITTYKPLKDTKNYLKLDANKLNNFDEVAKFLKKTQNYQNW